MNRKTVEIALIGCGHMGGALLESWFKKGVGFDEVVILDPGPHAKERFPEADIRTDAADLSDITAKLLIIAVKPQIMDKVLPGLPALLHQDGAVVSIAAGITIETFEGYFGAHVPVIRVMPNIPSIVGAGMSVLVANEKTSDDTKIKVEALLDAAGETAWVGDEELLHAVTALSGSGPAYIFHLAEAMEEAGKSAGLDKETARKLAYQTVFGSAIMLRESVKDASTLRKEVAISGGTTEAALKSLMHEQRFTSLIIDAVAKAKERSMELAQIK